MRKFRTMITIILTVVLLVSGTAGEISTEVYAKETENVFAKPLDFSSCGSNKNIQALSSDMEIKGNNSLGVMVANSMTSKQQEQSENNGCNIFSATVKKKCVSVSFETVLDGTLVVGIYDEEGVKMLASSKTEIKAGDKSADITIETNKMPEYFYLRVFLVDSNTLQPLTSSYECPNYTEEMQEFLSKTTEDFAQDRVLNMDEDETTNFAVYSENTIMIPQNNRKNQLVSSNEETGKYVFKNADINITSLQIGDIFAYSMDNGCKLIVKVAEVERNGTSVIITGEDSSLEEAFEYVKIDAQAGTDDATIDTSNCSQGVVCNGLAESETEKSTTDKKAQSVSSSNQKVTVDAGQVDAVDMEESQKHTLSYEFFDVRIVGDDENGVKMSGKAELEKEVSVKVYISHSYQYLELKMDYGLKADISVSGKGKGEIELGTLGFSPVAGVIIEVAPKFIVESSAKISLEHTLIGTIGFAVSSDEGMKNITSFPELKSSLKTEGTIFIGLSIEPRIVVINEKVAKVGLEAKVGGELKGEVILRQSDTSSKIHTCKKCIDGDIFGKFTLEFETKLLNSDKLKYQLKLTDNSIKVADFYYSFDKNEGGWTECPNLKHKVEVKVKDKSGAAIEEASIEAPFSLLNGDGTISEKEEIKTNADGEATGYLSNGEYTLQIKKNGYKEVEKRITVENESKSVEVELEEEIKEDLLDVSLYLDEFDHFVEKVRERTKEEEVLVDTAEFFQTDTFDIQRYGSEFGVYNKGCNYISLYGIEIGDIKSSILEKIQRQGTCYYIEDLDGSSILSVTLNGEEGVFATFNLNTKGQVISWSVSNYLDDICNLAVKLLKMEKEYGINELNNWQKSYLDYIFYTCGGIDADRYKYSLLYVNNDKIPELVIGYGSIAGGTDICTYGNDGLDVIHTYVDGLSYFEYENLLCDSGGRMDKYYDKIYCIQDGKFKLLYSGNYGAEDNSKVEYDENGYPIYQYYWDNVEVTETEYETKKNKYFDSAKAKELEQEEIVECEEIIEEILKVGVNSKSIQKQSLSTPKSTSSSANFSNLQPNQSYIFYAVKDKNSDNVLSPENLLYINQAVADDSGKVQFVYELKENYDKPELFLSGGEETDIIYPGKEDFIFQTKEPTTTVPPTQHPTAVPSATNESVYTDKEIEKHTQTIFMKKQYTCTYGHGDFPLNAKLASGGKLSYISQNPDVVTVSEEGMVSIVGAGTAEVVVKAEETETYASAEVKVKIVVSPRSLQQCQVAFTRIGEFDCEDEEIEKYVILMDGEKILKEEEDYQYNGEQMTYIINGKQKIASITIEGKGNYTGIYTWTLFPISEQPSLQSAEITKKGIELTWKKEIGGLGYSIYRKAGNGTYKKIKTIDDKYITTWVDKTALKAGEKYTYKIRVYTKNDGQTIYSKFSVPKSVRIPGMSVKISGKAYYDYAFQVLKLVNKEREKEGVSPLIMDEKLLSVAMQRAAEINVYFSHTRPDGSECSTSISNVSLPAFGENIAAGQTSPTEVMNCWMNSSGHRANILSENYNAIGIGCYKAGNYLYWVQIFGQKATIDKASKTNYKDRQKTITVSADSPFVSIRMSIPNKSLKKGSVKKVQMKVTNKEFPQAFITLSNTQFTFSSSNKRVAKVSSKGAVKGYKRGKAKITAKFKNSGKVIKKTITVTVK